MREVIFFKDVEVDGVLENDFLYYPIRFPKFFDEAEYVISKDEYLRPDLVSFKVYGNVDLWWVILQYNNIMDFWELVPGKKLLIPNYLDVSEFLRGLRVR